MTSDEMSKQEEVMKTQRQGMQWLVALAVALVFVCASSVAVYAEAAKKKLEDAGAKVELK